MSSNTANLICNSIEITPSQSWSNTDVMLAGFGSRTKGFEGIHDPLEANLIVLEHKAKKHILLSLDVLFIGQDLKFYIEDLAQQYFKVSSKAIIVCASHTHYAPATDITKPKLGLVSEKYIQYIKGKLYELFEISSQMVADAVTLEKQYFPMHSAVNRRRKGWHIDPVRLRLSNGVYMAPNFENTSHESAHILHFIDGQKKVKAVLWSYACHPTSFPMQEHISADFPGIVRADIRSSSEADIPVVFLQGLAGDKRAPETGGNISLKGRICRCIGGPHFGKFDMKTYQEWAQSLSKDVINAFNNKEAWKTISPDLSAQRIQIDIAKIIDGATPQKSFYIQNIQLADDLNIISMSAEPVSDYEDIIQQELSLNPENVISIGYTDDVFGYLPTKKMSEEGGYEAEGFFDAFNLNGAFTTDFEAHIRKGLHELSEPKNQENAA